MILIGILYVEAISFTAPEKKTRLKANSERWFDNETRGLPKN